MALLAEFATMDVKRDLFSMAAVKRFVVEVDTDMASSSALDRPFPTGKLTRVLQRRMNERIKWR